MKNEIEINVEYPEEPRDILYLAGFEVGYKKAYKEAYLKAQSEKWSVPGIRNMLKLNYDDGIIAKVFEVDLDFVYEIKKQLAKEPETAVLPRRKNADINKMAKQ